MKFIIGSTLILFAILVFGLTYAPIIQQEISYSLKSKNVERNRVSNEISPVDFNFGIIIPKIGANTHVIENVNPFESKEYQIALTKGVAHAKGSALPGEVGNIFLFSHSSSDFLNATKYNSIFYLLSKLESGDQIKLFFRDMVYDYSVTDKMIVSSSAINYLTDSSGHATLTLMTCWPPGTSIKRLIVRATLDK